MLSYLSDYLQFSVAIFSSTFREFLKQKYMVREGTSFNF
ncbi:hypothetical protein RintRC_4559 [Richelia intracellularis]|nr:hypothetical protein RintRC_4559 [Richelia intracellularis]